MILSHVLETLCRTQHNVFFSTKSIKIFLGLDNSRKIKTHIYIDIDIDLYKCIYTYM